MDRYDFVVVGQGLAGTTLAWQLRWRGFRVLVIDRGNAATTSRVAAGLITPITGQRLAVSWRLNDLYPAAVAFYRRVERETGSHFFTCRPVVRLFRDERERAIFKDRAENMFYGLIEPDVPVVEDKWFAGSLGGFTMIATGQLAVAQYLDASRSRFRVDGGFLIGEFGPGEVESVSNGVWLKGIGVAAGRVIFCRGIAESAASAFESVRFNPVKGELLTLRVPGLMEERVVNRGVWLAPVGGDLFRAGSTYDRDNLDATPTSAGRAAICEELGEFLRLPFEVVAHDAAVRPIVDESKPVLGLHPDCEWLGIFNGLGSKGVLVAPYYADHFAGFLAGEHPLDPEVDLRCGLGV